MFPCALARGGPWPLVLFAFAAGSDYVDGPLARRLGSASARGAVLDNVADVAFVLGGAMTAAWLGLVAWVVPAAIGASVASYAIASRRLARAAGAPRLARTRVGHWAGVVNYVLAGMVAGAVAWPDVVPRATLAIAGAAVVALNGGAVVLRWVGR